MKSITSKSVAFFATAVLAVGSLFAVSAAQAQGTESFEYIDRSDGGVEIKYGSGCHISYDRQAQRQGHAGSCSQQQFVRADKAASSFLRGTTSRSAGSGGPQLSAKTDGGVEARFPSGCFIAYDRNAKRGGHAGSCSDREYARADRDAAAYLTKR